MASTLNYLSETYSFAAIREFLFDSSHPSWKTLSTTRAPSLLRRAISWVTVLQMFITNKLSEVEPLLGDISRFDPNAGQWLLERIQEILGERVQYRRALVDLYYTIILGAYPEEVKAVAITCLASALSFVLDFHNDTVSQIDLSWEALEKHLKHASTEHIWNRDRSDAELVLEGCLLALKTISGGQSSELDILEWATRLQSAMQEETVRSAHFYVISSLANTSQEFTTRLAAVSSVTGFARILRPAGSPPRTDSVLLEIYLVLYDMLNDDDEELRDLAASTASWVLSCSSVSPTKAVALSPLNASELLSKFIAENYASSRLLCQRTMAYIADQEPRLSSATPKFVSFLGRLSELRKESTILFEEEKQNLFIDEVREVDVWSARLRQLNESSYDEGSLNALFNWVSNGLASLEEILAKETEKDGLLGWASKTETFTLGVRVFSVAGAVISKDSAASRLLGQEQAALLKGKLQALLASGEASLLHDDWVSRIQAALELS